ncbi:MAG: hypothetical protein LWX52_03250, partial [Deltaproteobacteria bacterium]|nr:hypothetical protein [Deltaproteobacteria bacterium]
IDLQIINCTRIEGKIRVRRTLGYVVEDFDLIYVKVYSPYNFRNYASQLQATFARSQIPNASK